MLFKKKFKYFFNIIFNVLTFIIFCYLILT